MNVAKSMEVNEAPGLQNLVAIEHFQLPFKQRPPKWALKLPKNTLGLGVRE